MGRRCTGVFQIDFFDLALWTLIHLGATKEHASTFALCRCGVHVFGCAYAKVSGRTQTSALCCQAQTYPFGAFGRTLQEHEALVLLVFLTELSFEIPRTNPASH